MADISEKNVSNKAVLLVSILASFVTPLITTSIPIALPSIVKEFSMEAILSGWVATSFTLATAALMVPIGRIADIYGRRKIFTYGILLFTVSSFLCAISKSATFLISFIVIQGIGAAMTWGPNVAIITSAFPAEKRGRALGINTAAIYLGLSLGPFWGGLLTQHLGWRYIFFFTPILSVAVAILAFWKLKGEWAEARGERLDITGSIILSISLILTMYGFTVLLTIRGIVLVFLGLLGILAFVRFESKTKSPVLNVSLFRNNRVFIFSNLAALIHYCANFAAPFLLSLYLQYNKGFSPQTAGLILVVQPAVMAIFAPIAGRLSDKIEPVKLASIGMGATCLALVLLSFLTQDSDIKFIIVNLALIGFGIGFFATPNTNAVMSSVERKFFGVASGTIATMRHSGQVLSMGIAMILFAIYIGKAQITPEYYPAFLASSKTAFIIFAALCFGGIFASLARGKVR